MNLADQVVLLLSNEGCGVLSRKHIDPEIRLFDIGFDSLRYMEFVVLLEERLSITVPDDMLDVRAETTVADIIRMVSTCNE